MSLDLRSSLLVVVATLAACGQPRDITKEAETAGPQFANLCIKRSQWPDLIQRMRGFGASHGMEFHGGIDKATPDRQPQFNAYLAKGYSYVFGDDFDLWFTSDTFREDVITLGGIVKHQPITTEEKQLARELLIYVKDTTSLANGPPHNPNCASVTVPSNVR